MFRKKKKCAKNKINQIEFINIKLN